MPGPQYQSDEELAFAAGNIGTTIFHPVGTCKMGKDHDPLAVVDSKLQVRGVAEYDFTARPGDTYWCLWTVRAGLYT